MKLKGLEDNRLVQVIVSIVLVTAAYLVMVWFFTRFSDEDRIRSVLGQKMMDNTMRAQVIREMRGAVLPPGIDPQKLPDPKSKGAALTARYCGQCHNLTSPAMHSAVKWPEITKRMFARMYTMSRMVKHNMTAAMKVKSPSLSEQGMILSYLRKHSLKTLSYDKIPSPNSEESHLYREVCAKCHELPDINQHTAAEWPEVIKRMRANMREMGKRIITDNETQVIREYLIYNTGL
ncbi:MAG: hypothetical protein IEMM0002_0463 [bacterium]|nr:MAG: hypothetical protein IEMM0002_0463 [bacterium]